MSTLIEGSGTVEDLISIFSPLLLFQPSGDAVLSRNTLYSLLAKMSFPKAYLSYPVRAGRR